MCFQDYALFPHLSVEETSGFAGRERAPSYSSASESRISRGRNRESLSGGERQRVGLARALARVPRCCCSTSRSSALDAHTRAGVRAELHELLDGLRLPTLLVTHDYEDAAALAGRIGVLVEGKLLYRSARQPS